MDLKPIFSKLRVRIARRKLKSRFPPPISSSPQPPKNTLWAYLHEARSSTLFPFPARKPPANAPIEPPPVPLPSPPPPEIQDVWSSPAPEASPEIFTPTFNPDAPPPLLSLPNELLLCIVDHLTLASDVSSLLRTNRRLAALLSPLCLRRLDFSVMALCWGVVTADEKLTKFMLGKQGPGFVLLDAQGVRLWPLEGGEVGGVKRLFVHGPWLRVGIPGVMEWVGVRAWAEQRRARGVLSYCWCTDGDRGSVWRGMVREGVLIGEEGG